MITSQKECRLNVVKNHLYPLEHSEVEEHKRSKWEKYPAKPVVSLSSLVCQLITDCRHKQLFCKAFNKIGSKLLKK